MNDTDTLELTNEVSEEIQPSVVVDFTEFPSVFDGTGSDITNKSCSGCGGKIFFAISVATS